jgi:hypothetical protein
MPCEGVGADFGHFVDRWPLWRCVGELGDDVYDDCCFFFFNERSEFISLVLSVFFFFFGKKGNGFKMKKDIQKKTENGFM